MNRTKPSVDGEERREERGERRGGEVERIRKGREEKQGG